MTLEKKMEKNYARTVADNARMAWVRAGPCPFCVGSERGWGSKGTC